MQHELNDRQQALSASLAAHYPSEMHSSLAGVTTHHATISESVSERHAIQVTGLEVRDSDASSSAYYLINTLPSLSSQVFMAICSQGEPEGLIELCARLDARSEVDDSLKTGHFDRIDLRTLNNDGWYGYFLVPVNKWIKAFPKTLNTPAEHFKCSLVVLLTQSELKLAEQQGNRALYQYLRDERKIVYYANTLPARSLGRRLQHREKATIDNNNALTASKAFPYEQTSALDEHQVNLELNPASHQLPRLPTNTDVHAQFSTLGGTTSPTEHHWGNERTYPATDENLDTKDLETTDTNTHTQALPSAQTRAATQTHKRFWNFATETTRATAYDRLVSDLKIKLHANAPPPKIPEQLPNHGIYEDPQPSGNSVMVHSYESLLAHEAADASSASQAGTHRLINRLANSQQAFKLPNLSPRIKMIGETLFGAIVLTASLVLAGILLVRGQSMAALIPGLFSIAGVIILREAYLSARGMANANHAATSERETSHSTELYPDNLTVNSGIITENPNYNDGTHHKDSNVSQNG